MDSISVAILCGGQSKRFGQDKCAYKYQGRPLYRIVYQRLKNFTDDIFLQSSRNQNDFGPDIPVHEDLVESGGSLGGIYSALHHAKHQKVFITACDMPKIDPQILTYTAEYLDHPVVVPRWESGHYEPLCAIYSKEIAHKVKKMLDNKQFKVSLLYEKVNEFSELSIDSLIRSGQIAEDCFVNINKLKDHPSL